MHPLLPPHQEQHYLLRKRSHGYKLPEHTSSLNDSNFLTRMLYKAGRSGLAVACLTAVREVLGSNRAVSSCVYRTTTAIYSLGHGLCAPFLQCLDQLSLLRTLRGTVNEYQLSG